MTAQQLAAVDLLLTQAATVPFAGAAVLVLSARPAATGLRIGALVCAGLGGLAVTGRVAVVVALAGDGWWFVADKVLLALPLAVLTAAVAAVAGVPALVRSGPPAEPAGRRAAAGLFVAGYGSAAGLYVAFVVGYPVDPAPAAVLVLLVVGLAGLTWLGLVAPHRRGPTVAFVLLGVMPLLASAGLVFYRHLQPVVVGAGGAGHHLAASGPFARGPAAGSAGPVSVPDLRTPDGAPGPVKRFALAARTQPVTLPSGRVIDGWTFGSLPGPEIRVSQGDLVEVTLTNENVADGVTLHWHGYRVPNGEDGVAGVTQDAVGPGESFTYRFVASDPGSYWYHAHQVSSEAVRRGLFGVLVVEPQVVEPPAPPADLDIAVPLHTFNGVPVVGDTDGVLTGAAAPGARVRVRVVNTDPIPHRISVTGSRVTVAAVDGTDLVGPVPVDAPVLRIPAGGRYDVVVAMPDDPAGAIGFGVEGAPGTGLRLSAAGGAAPVPFVDGPDLDLLGYGAPDPSAAGRAAPVTREATLVLDRQFRFLGGIPTLAQTVNGEVHPFVPPIEVTEGDVLRLTVVNRSAETHPMHPHGHRVLVESRNGEPARGSPLWLDTFDVQPGEVWTVLLRADNPGIWMAHCHNLEHATQGMVVHLTYQGVSTPYTPGGGPADNRPE